MAMMAKVACGRFGQIDAQKGDAHLLFLAARVGRL